MRIRSSKMFKRFIKQFFHNQKGDVDIGLKGILIGVISVAIVIALMPMVTSSNITESRAYNYLDNLSYALASPGGTFTGNVDATTVTADTLNAPTGRAATYVIAASDASTRVKAQADEVLDGIADQVQINAAITAMGANGKIALVGTTFRTTAAIAMNQDYTMLEGLGMYSTSIIPADGSTHNIIEVTAQHNEISHLHINGNRTNCPSGGNGVVANGAPFFRMQYVGVQECKGNGILLQGATSVGLHFSRVAVGQCDGNSWSMSSGIADVWLNDCEGSESALGLYCEDPSTLWLQNCWFDYNTGNGILLYRVGTTADFGRDVWISNNHIQGNAQGIFLAVAAAKTEQRIHIVGNLLKENTSYAIGDQFQGAGDGILRAVEISGNTFDGNDYDLQFNGALANYNDNQIKNNNFDNTSHDIITWGVPADSLAFQITGNTGYISPSEIRTASGSLTAGNANVFSFAWQNPELQAITITELMIDVTTVGGTPASLLDCGSAANATTTSSDLINDLDLNALGVTVSTARNIKLAANGGATDWLTGQILAQNAAGLVGKYYIKYIGQ
jgi:hypothetical protein